MLFNPDACHDNKTKNLTPALGFNESRDFNAWKKEVREKLIDLAGIHEIEKNDCPLALNIIAEEQKDGYKQIQFSFTSETACEVPAYILIPDGDKKKYPVAITMQGHSSGFHNSVGEIHPGDESYHPRGAFALQAVKNGFIGLCIENRSMGCRGPKEPERKRLGGGCNYPGRVALTLGRTLLGERMWDLSKLVDLISTFKEFEMCDTDKILITGNSGGGTISYYAACYDERIKLSAPSCAFCSYDTSIYPKEHCVCNHIPNIRRYFEMADISCLLAPRNVVVFAGSQDSIFPLYGVEEAFEHMGKIYDKAGVSRDKLKLVITPKGHWWCHDLIWPILKEETTKLGWWK